MIINKKDLPRYRYLHIFAMLFLMLMLCDSVLTYKFVVMPFGYAEACVFIIPFWFTLGDVITEVYGLKLSRNILWSAFIVEIIFGGVCFCLVHLPSPAFWKNEPSFELVLGHLPRVIFSSAIAIILSGYINTYCVSKWKALLQGRYFWLRSIGASWISEGVYSVIAVYCILMDVVPLDSILVAIFWSYLSKLILTLVLSIPAALIAALVKIKEKVTDYPVSFNPFK